MQWKHLRPTTTSVGLVLHEAILSSYIDGQEDVLRSTGWSRCVPANGRQVGVQVAVPQLLLLQKAL